MAKSAFSRLTTRETALFDRCATPNSGLSVRIERIVRKQESGFVWSRQDPSESAWATAWATVRAWATAWANSVQLRSEDRAHIEDRRLRKAWTIVMTLSFSRHSHVVFVFDSESLRGQVFGSVPP
jgi:hypothetical protein